MRLLRLLNSTKPRRKRKVHRYVDSLVYGRHNYKNGLVPICPCCFSVQAHNNIIMCHCGFSFLYARKGFEMPKMNASAIMSDVHAAIKEEINKLQKKIALAEEKGIDVGFLEEKLDKLMDQLMEDSLEEIDDDEEYKEPLGVVNNVNPPKNVPKPPQKHVDVSSLKLRYDPFDLTPRAGLRRCGADKHMTGAKSRECATCNLEKQLAPSAPSVSQPNLNKPPVAPKTIPTLAEQIASLQKQISVGKENGFDTSGKEKELAALQATLQAQQKPAEKPVVSVYNQFPSTLITQLAAWYSNTLQNRLNTRKTYSSAELLYDLFKNVDFICNNH